MNFLVTGAGNGIGFQTVLALAAESGTRIVAISRNRENLNKLVTASQEQKGGSEVLMLAADLNTLSPEILLPFLRDHGISRLDGLVNNAGMLVNKPFEQITTDDFRQVYETNVFAPVRIISMLLPLLKLSGRAHILNIGSLGGFQGSSKFMGLSAYSSSKAALACLTECLALELTEYKISVNALALGAVDTEMLQQAYPGYQAPVSAKEMGSYIATFLRNGHKVYNGKILPVALSSV